MEIHKPRLAILVLFLSTCVIWAAVRDPSCEFDLARKEIKRQSAPCLVYSDKLCSEIVPGEDKIACRLQNVPSVGFLVCKFPESEGKKCYEIIQEELESLSNLKKANINTVDFDTSAIHSVKCGEAPDKTCSGFLEGWIDESDGRFLHVRDSISGGNVEINKLIAVVKGITSQGGLAETIADLRKIVAFMEPAPPDDNYKQICDLQGIFLNSGGFKVADTPNINENIARDKGCWPGEPTTDQVLVALKRMIAEFGKAVRRWKYLKN